jgi:hypothetical protein
VKPAEFLTAFDRYLAARNIRLKAVVIGGALRLLEQQDANPDWPAHVRATLADVARRLGHGL